MNATHVSFYVLIQCVSQRMVEEEEEEDLQAKVAAGQAMKRCNCFPSDQ